MPLPSAVYRNLVFPMLFRAQRLDIVGKMEALRLQEARGFAEVVELQREKCARLLQTAREGSRYYGRILENLPELGSDPSALRRIPLLTKTELQDAAGDLPVRGYSGTARSTAGTTGAPVTVTVDADALSWQLATRYFLFGWHGIRIGDREARFWGRPLQGIGAAVKDFLLNRRRFTFCAGSDRELLREYRELVAYRPDYFYGYSSLILNAALLCEKHQLAPPPLKAIICTAELLGAKQRDFIAKVFGCPVVVEYGCTESDILAFECEHRRLHVMSHNVYVDRDLFDGGLVYTDLNNLATPLINYRLGDRVELDQGTACPCQRRLPIISGLEGRTIKQVLTFPDGSTMHVVKLAYLIEDIANMGVEILQFKIVKLKEELLFLVNLSGEHAFFEREMKKGLERMLQGKIGYLFKYGPIKAEEGRKFSYYEELEDLSELRL